MLIAWFVLQSGRAELVTDLEREPLAALRCGALAEPSGTIIAPDATCDAAINAKAGGFRRFA